MNQSGSSLLHDKFSHIYIEKQAKGHPVTKSILEKFPNAVNIETDHYKDIFNRNNQDFQTQKASQKLILAVKRDKLIYEGAKVCQNFGHKHFYYTSSVLNCIYNCDYCYLQGMFPSANIVVFVNIEDYLAQVELLLKEHPIYLTVSYDTDLLAFEGIYPFTAQWIGFAGKSPGLTVEIRTKSANYKAISHLKPNENTILAWTISPDEIAGRHEKNTPSLASRLDAVKNALWDGWKVRLCFDPLLVTDNWETIYARCIDETFKAVEGKNINDISIGVFRMASNYLKKIKKANPGSIPAHYPYECVNGVYSYPDDIKQRLTDFVYCRISNYIDKERIFIL